MKIFREVLPAHSFELLKDIKFIDAYSEFYLAGGTALALQLGHRISVDLDFFTAREFKTNILEDFPFTYETNILSHNSIEIISKETKVFFWRYAFPLKHELKLYKNIQMADPIDIGFMKLLALQGRSTRKDIIDLYFIDREVIKLEDLLVTFEKQYSKESFNEYSSLKSLFNFEELESQPMPKLFKEVDWEECLEIVTRKVATHLKGLLGS